MLASFRLRWLIHRWVLFGVVLVLGVGSLLGWYFQPDPHLVAAEQELQHRNYAKAYAHLQECLKRRPHAPHLLFLAARTARRAALYDQFEKHLRDCQRLQGETDAIVLEKMLARAQQGDFDVEAYLKARAEGGDPDTLLIWEVLIQQYVQNFRLWEALDLLNRYLERRPDDVASLLGRGFVYERLFEYSNALRDYRRAIELAPEDDNVRQRLAETLLIAGPPTEAVEQFTLLHQRQPDNPDVLLGLARAQVLVGHNEEARQLLDELLAEHPRRAAVLAERGRLALAEGSFTQAEAWLRQAAALAPFDRQILYNLYQCVKRCGSETEIRKCRARLDQVDADLKRLDAVTQAVLQRPNDPALRCEAGIIFLRNGEEKEGLRWLDMALRLDPNYAPARRALADYFQRKRTRREP